MELPGNCTQLFEMLQYTVIILWDCSLHGVAGYIKDEVAHAIVYFPARYT
jgi:hypothetical protein